MTKIVDYNDVEILRKEYVVLKNVTFNIAKGEFTYLVGRVGSGKSSLLKSMYAEIPISEGEASVLDYDLTSLKRRDIEQTVPWLVGGPEALDEYGVDVSDETRALARAFWPGALTLIVRAAPNVPAFMQAADGTVALRASASPVVRALVHMCKSPLAVTSANTHGAPAPASFSAAEPRILAGVDVAIDAQETPCQDASTIVSARGGSVEIVRHGAISDEEIYRVVQGV